MSLSSNGFGQGGQCGGLGLPLGLVSELGVASDSSWGVVQ